MSRLLAFAAVALVIANTAEAQQNCAERTLVIDRLAERFGETRQTIGLGQHNHVVETFASVETGTWTITVTRPNGMTCLVASGTGFERVEEDLKPAGTRS